MKLSFAIYLFSSLISLNATELNCKILHNMDPVFHAEVSTTEETKTLIGSAEGINASITEKKNNIFVLEAYLADYDVRGYSEGLLNKEKDKLTFTLWGRASLAEVSCALSQK